MEDCLGHSRRRSSSHEGATAYLTVEDDWWRNKSAWGCGGGNSAGPGYATGKFGWRGEGLVTYMRWTEKRLGNDDMIVALLKIARPLTKPLVRKGYTTKTHGNWIPRCWRLWKRAEWIQAKFREDIKTVVDWIKGEARERQVEMKEREDKSEVVWKEVRGFYGLAVGSCRAIGCRSGMWVKEFTQALVWLTVNTKYEPVPKGECFGCGTRGWESS